MVYIDILAQLWWSCGGQDWAVIQLCESHQIGQWLTDLLGDLYNSVLKKS